MRFAGKNVIVTGGAQGIGKAICLEFASLGAKVFIADIDPEAGRELEREIRGSVFIETDVGDPAAVEDMVRRTGKATRVHVLVNNAGIGDNRDVVERTVAQWDRVLNVNLRAAYLCVRACLDRMPKGSAVINISSTRALMSEPGTAPYSASKAGLLGLTHSLAVSLAPRGIRVNAVSPGWIDTSAWKKRSTAKQEKLSEADHKQHPAGRVGRPEDIAKACVFLADPEQSGFITGHNHVCDGGMTVKMIYEE